MPTYRHLSDIDIQGKRVLLRAGFDLPIDNGVVTDTARIEALIPTMKEILSKGASLVIMAHQGRPKGKIVPEESQKPIVPVLEKLLGIPVQFAMSCVGPETLATAQALQPGQVLLLENLRYDAREDKNDPVFAQELAALADVYVNDAFSNSHREHASMVGVPTLLPSAMGLHLAKEVESLSKIVDATTSLCVIVSGAKLETKVPVIDSLLPKATSIIVGGAIANTFLAAQGKPIGKSLSDPAEVPTAQKILAAGGDKISLPVDVVVAAGPGDGANAKVVGVDDVTPDAAILDAGPASREVIAKKLATAKVIVWNGPLGYTEEEAFADGSKALAAAITAATKSGAFSVIGGGDTLDFHARYGLPLDAYSFVSTGGGAMLDFLSAGSLPAVDALRA